MALGEGFEYNTWGYISMRKEFHLAGEAGWVPSGYAANWEVLWP
jgi:hypothetical protein